VRAAVITGLVLVNLAFTVASNVGFKWSALSTDWRTFVTWQVVGNLAGFLSVLAFTALLRLISLHLAYAVTAGLGFLAVQVIGAHLIFHEMVTRGQWLGIVLIVSGIVLVSLAHQDVPYTG